MERFIVTIQRQYGSSGRMIAARMSEILGIEYYDYDIAEETAQELALPVSVVKEEEEKAERQPVFAEFTQNIMPAGKRTTQEQDEIFRAQKRIIRDIAERGSCVIVGHCADFILEKADNVMNIYIYASYQKRLEHCVKDLHLTAEEAADKIREEDEERDSYHMRYAGFLPDDRAHKDLLIDSGFFGPEGTAQLLADAVRRKFGLNGGN